MSLFNYLTFYSSRSWSATRSVKLILKYCYKMDFHFLTHTSHFFRGIYLSTKLKTSYICIGSWLKHFVALFLDVRIPEMKVESFRLKSLTYDFESTNLIPSEAI